MRHNWFAVSFVAAGAFLDPLSAASAPAGEVLNLPARKLVLVWYDAYQMAPQSFEILSQEVDQVFYPLGVAVEWKLGRQGANSGPSAGNAAFGEIMVILLPTDPVGWGLGKDVMGVVMGEEVPRRAIYLFYPAVARTLGYQPKGERSIQPKWIRDVGRALGRVVSHELVHALAPEQPHAADGLMSCQLRRPQLIAPRSALDPESAAVFLAELDRARWSRFAGTSPAAGRPGNKAGAEAMLREPAVSPRGPALEREPMIF
jgi:hypothetical protein